MIMNAQYALIGLGIGPFHLSLAAMAEKLPMKTLFLDQKPHFQWHPELMFEDADMQTSWLKDLVSPVDPTSPFSFMNYLVQNGLFYAFMNTNRRIITRKEFELYCQWVSVQMKERLSFETQIQSVEFHNDQFVISTDKNKLSSQNISIATGLIPRVPEFAKTFLGPAVFHAKSPELATMDLREKRVIVVGGGQTGVEIFRNALKGKWGRAKSLRLISSRRNLEPLDESPFTNEYFTPDYVNQFFSLNQTAKDPIVSSQKLASDGNTPKYLEMLYQDLYQIQHVHKDPLDFKILPLRRLTGLEKSTHGFTAQINNYYSHSVETMDADIIILSTGFCTSIPKILDPIKELLFFDDQNRLMAGKNFNLDWKGPKENKIYALNFSRHRHGIAEPQTSLMAWRSATIINDLAQNEIYKMNHEVPTFIQYGNN